MFAMTEPKRILIVDDEPANLLALSYTMRAKEVEVITASRLEPAEEALARYAFDLVIVDIRMSGILGIEGLEHATAWVGLLDNARCTRQSTSSA